MQTRIVVPRVLGLVFVALGLLVWRTAPGADPPERGIVAAFEYPGKIIESDESLNLNLILKNNGRKDETIFLEVQQVPAEWEAQVQQLGTVITGVFLTSGEKKSLSLDDALVTRMPAAVAMKSAGICVTRPSPTVRIE